ncbi:hypothetical protein PR048_033504 [Dryococelus australis]|uniref:Uncharacterized protein n=1 Tax=Dryococelus australis TaxID=614101 RepID=A0ABQ9G0H1_9NEOP|nr:hypothetical protein PR048_033504 [Dryococelus australis]
MVSTDKRQWALEQVSIHSPDPIFSKEFVSCGGLSMLCDLIADTAVPLTEVSLCLSSLLSILTLKLAPSLSPEAIIRVVGFVTSDNSLDNRIIEDSLTILRTIVARKRADDEESALIEKNLSVSKIIHNIWNMDQLKVQQNALALINALAGGENSSRVLQSMSSNKYRETIYRNVIQNAETSDPTAHELHVYQNLMLNMREYKLKSMVDPSGEDHKKVLDLKSIVSNLDADLKTLAPRNMDNSSIPDFPQVRYSCAPRVENNSSESEAEKWPRKMSFQRCMSASDIEDHLSTSSLAPSSICKMTLDFMLYFAKRCIVCERMTPFGITIVETAELHLPLMSEVNVGYSGTAHYPNEPGSFHACVYYNISANLSANTSLDLLRRVTVSAAENRWTSACRRETLENRHPASIAGRTLGGGSSVMVWGMFSRYSQGPIIHVEGTLDRSGNDSILDDYIHQCMMIVFPWEDGIFQHYNAPCYVAISGWMSTIENSKFFPGPQIAPISIQLNICGTTSIVVFAICLLHHTPFNSCGTHCRQRLIESLPARLTAVRAAKASDVLVDLRYTKSYARLMLEEMSLSHSFPMTCDRLARLVCDVMGVGRSPKRDGTLFQPMVFATKPGLQMLEELFCRSLSLLGRTRREMRARSLEDEDKFLMGYEDVKSTKRAEQKRRGTSKTSVDVNFSENMLVTAQQSFLTNEKNNNKLIELSVETLTARGIEVSTATGDIDGSIVRRGLNKVTSHSSVVVIGEDVDLIVLLTALTPPGRKVYFMKPGRGNIEDKVYSTRQLYALPFSGSILFIHSFTGSMADIFYDPTSTPDAVAQAQEEMFLTMYQAPPSERDLNNHRCNSFVKSSTKVKANLASLPPIQCAAKQHSLRVYLLTQRWLDDDSLNPAHWGWVRDDGGVLNPVETTYPTAPDSVFPVVRRQLQQALRSRPQSLEKLEDMLHNVPYHSVSAMWEQERADREQWLMDNSPAVQELKETRRPDLLELVKEQRIELLKDGMDFPLYNARGQSRSTMPDVRSMCGEIEASQRRVLHVLGCLRAGFSEACVDLTLNNTRGQVSVWAERGFSMTCSSRFTTPEGKRQALHKDMRLSLYNRPVYGQAAIHFLRTLLLATLKHQLAGQCAASLDPTVTDLTCTVQPPPKRLGSLSAQLCVVFVVQREKKKLRHVYLTNNQKTLIYRDYDESSSSQGKLQKVQLSSVTYLVTGKRCPHVKDISVGALRSDRDMRFNSLIAPTSSALNWHVVLALVTRLYETFRGDPTRFIGFLHGVNRNSVNLAPKCESSGKANVRMFVNIDTSACMLGDIDTSACMLGDIDTSACMLGDIYTSVCMLGDIDTSACMLGDIDTSACMSGGIERGRDLSPCVITQRKMDTDLLELSFSLLLEEEPSSLDLVAPNKTIFDCWVDGLNALLGKGLLHFGRLLYNETISVRL